MPPETFKAEVRHHVTDSPSSLTEGGKPIGKWRWRGFRPVLYSRLNTDGGVQMSTDATPALTELLLSWRQGDVSALDRLVVLLYPELRRLAHRYMQGERSGHTLQTTALVNELYLRLIDSRLVHWRDRAHFLAVSAQLMRRILVDSARARRADKRGGGTAPIQMEDALAAFEARGRDLVALDDALTELAAVDPQKARLIELRFFGGLTMAEIAEVLGMTADAARWNWRLARAWLLRELGTEVQPDTG